MMRLLMAAGLVLTIVAIAPGRLQAQDETQKGAKVYRSCAACHSLEPDVHLTGPSLAGLWEKKAGSVTGFDRYSKALKTAEITWDENALNAWLANPQNFLPGNYMTFRGIENDAARRALIAFLKIVLAPNGANTAVKKGLIPKDLATGQVPEPIAGAGPDQKITAIRHCRDTYFVTTANGKETPFWEMNVRLKTDSSARGPRGGQPVLVRAGMMGDRVSIVFSTSSEIGATVEPKC